MPGLIGYSKYHSMKDDSLHLEEMANRLEPEARFQRNLFEEGKVGLGRVSLGILNPAIQPLWNRDHSRCIIMEGELYNQQKLKDELENNYDRNPLQTDSDAELALYMFETYGDDFAARLNGDFVLAIWDHPQRKLLITNDRLGLYPLYYAHAGNKLSFASGVRALLADPQLSHAIDKIAFAQFLTFDHVLDDRTYLEAVKLLPQASVLTYMDGRLKIHPYWKLHYLDLHELRDEKEDIDQLNHLLQQAVRRRISDDPTKGLLLSGGLDSRVILAEMAEALNPKQIHTFSWGIPGCDDCRAAKELAAIAGSNYHFYELKPDWLIEKANEAVARTDGLGNIANLHALAAAGQEAAIAPILFKGFLGDAMFGYAAHRRLWGNYDEQTSYLIHQQTHRGNGVIYFDSSDYPALFTDDFNKEVGDAVFESYRAGMKRSNASQLAIQRLYFDLTQRVPRMTLNGVEVVRGYAAVRLPFADNDLVDFSLVIPPGYLHERYIAYLAFTSKYHRFAKVPNPSTGLPMVSCARDTLLRARKDLRWQIRTLGLEKLLAPEARPYKDYGAWFRHELRHWVESTLLNPHSLERGIFYPDTIRQKVAEHMAGKDYAVQLGGLLTLELWQQQFLD